MYTRGVAGSARWSSRFTDEEGHALFFVMPGSGQFWANFTLGGSLLASKRLEPVAWQGELPAGAPLAPPVQQVDTARCGGARGGVLGNKVMRAAAYGTVLAGAFALQISRWSTQPRAARSRVWPTACSWRDTRQPTRWSL